MPLTDRQREWMRDELGSVTDEDLDARFETWGNVRDATISLLRRKITAWLANPATVSLSGVASLSLKDNIAAVERRIAALLKMDTDPSDGTGVDEVQAAGPHVLQQFDIVRSRRR